MDLNTVAELMSAATQAPPLDYASLGLKAPPEATQQQAQQGKSLTDAEQKAAEAHANWLGFSTTQILIAGVEKLIVECADVAQSNVTSKGTDYGYVASLLSKRAAYQVILRHLKEDLKYVTK